jgi:hypothetical protein
MTYHSTRRQAQLRLEADGYTYHDAAQMGGGCYRNASGNRAIIMEAGSRSFDAKGKHWFLIRKYAA